MDRSAHEENRLSWNAVTPAHNRHKGDQAAFFREGGSTLFPEELGLLGDLTGKKVVHLQCNCGQDTLSLLALGAAEVLGVDISDKAVEFAEQLAKDAGFAEKAKFVRADLYDWFDSNTETFDIVFATYGAIGWLSDLKAYGKGIAKALKMGGRYILVEFHPMAWTFDESMTLKYPYAFTRDGIPNEDGISDYVQDSMLSNAADAKHDVVPFKNPHRTIEFAWGIGDTATVLLDAGLRIDSLTEYPYSNGCKIFNNCIDIGNRRYGLPPDVPALPMMFSISATSLS